MADTTTTGPAMPRYAPLDTTLPKPWRELIDGDTGNHYFWNRETGVTQYNRPGVEILPPPYPSPPPLKRDRDDDEHYSGWPSYQGIKGSEHHYHTADVGDGSAAEAYRRKHEIVVRGDDVPDPFTTFEAADFPTELLRESQKTQPQPQSQLQPEFYETMCGTWQQPPKPYGERWQQPQQGPFPNH